MNSKREQIEKILGGKITPFNEEPLPGLEPSDGSEVVYFANFAEDDIAEQLKQLARRIDPPHLKHGSVGATMHTLTLPNGKVFHAIKYRGDLDGWRRQIAEGAQSLDVVLGRIENGSVFRLSDGAAYDLAECSHGRI
jgi:hypothetical protein